MKDSARCQFSWTSPCLMDLIDQVVLNAKVLNTGQENCNRMVAATFQSTIQLWSVMVNNDGNLVTREIRRVMRKRLWRESCHCHRHQVSKWRIIVTQHHVCRGVLKFSKCSIEIMVFLISNLYTVYENVDHIIGYIKHNFFTKLTVLFFFVHYCSWVRVR